MNFSLTIGIGFSLIVVAIFTGSADAQSGSKKMADLPDGITSFGGAVLDGYLYTFGGHKGGAHHYYASGQNRLLQRLNLKHPEKWETVGEGPGLQGLAMVGHEKDLYRIGGFSALNKEEEDQRLVSQSEFARFDFASRQWEQLAPLPEPRSSFDAVVIGDTIYVVGGWTMDGDKETKWLETRYKYDLAADSGKWESLPKPPFKRRAVSLGFLGDSLYVIGGMQDKGGPTTKVAIFDLEKQVWKEGPNLPGQGMEGFGSSAFNVGGNLVVSTYGGHVYRLNAGDRQWEKITTMPEGRFSHRLLPISNTHVVLVGGANMESGKTDEIEVVKVSSK